MSLQTHFSRQTHLQSPADWPAPAAVLAREHSPRYESKNSQTVLPVNALDVCLLCASTSESLRRGSEVVYFRPGTHESCRPRDYSRLGGNEDFLARVDDTFTF